LDYIDLQSCPDVTEDGTFLFVLHGQDHLTKFSFLKAELDLSCTGTSRT